MLPLIISMVQEVPFSAAKIRTNLQQPHTSRCTFPCQLFLSNIRIVVFYIMRPCMFTRYISCSVLCYRNGGEGTLCCTSHKEACPTSTTLTITRTIRGQGDVEASTWRNARRYCKASILHTTSTCSRFVPTPAKIRSDLHLIYLRHDTTTHFNSLPLIVTGESVLPCCRQRRQRGSLG